MRALTSFTDSRAAAVRVVAPARLHMGFLDLNGDLGRRYGSLGLALEAPRTSLEIRAAPRFASSGPVAERALGYARRFMQATGVAAPVEIRVDEAIPEHVGLGSGTQLALAVGLGVARAQGFEPGASEVAARMGRGARSGIGIGAFESGGLLLDGGVKVGGGAPPLISRMECPAHWRVILVLDNERRGACGDAERDAFARLPQFSAAEAGQLCRLVLMQALPALAENDIVQFGRAVSELQRRVGAHFAPVQGGAYASARVGRLLDWLAHNGAAGIGQSSWGPTGFALCEDGPDASALLELARRRSATERGLEVRLCRPRNQPAELRVLAPAVRSVCRAETS